MLPPLGNHSKYMFYSGSTPLMESILHISETLLKMNFSEKGRTLKNLGIDGLNKDDFLKLL